MYKQGEASDSLFIIKQGIVSSYVEGEEGGEKASNTLVFPPKKTKQPAVCTYREGDLFGMSALTGGARQVTSVCETDVKVVEIKRQDLELLLEHEPSLRSRPDPVVQTS